MLIRIFTLIGLLVFSSCATVEQQSVGNVVFSGGLFGGAPVYKGNIDRKYTVIKEVRHKAVQINGPNYYDWHSGAAWMSRLGKDAGADAVINFGSRKIPSVCWNLFVSCTPEERANKAPEYYEAWGTAVKFVD